MQPECVESAFKCIHEHDDEENATPEDRPSDKELQNKYYKSNKSLLTAGMVTPKLENANMFKN